MGQPGETEGGYGGVWVRCGAAGVGLGEVRGLGWMWVKYEAAGIALGGGGIGLSVGQLGASGEHWDRCGAAGGSGLSIGHLGRNGVAMGHLELSVGHLRETEWVCGSWGYVGQVG